MSSRFHFGAASLLALVAALGTSGCKDQEKCDEAIRVTRDAISKEQTDLARQWRDHAWKLCEDAATMGNLDKEIVAKEAEIQKRAEDHAKALADASQKRMNTAQQVWKNFDKLDDEKKTLKRLRKHRDKAEKMANGLPPDYAKQIEEYNRAQFERREERLEEEDE